MARPSTPLAWRRLCAGLLIVGLVGCTDQPPPPVDPAAGPGGANSPPGAPRAYLAQVGFTPDAAKYFPLVDHTLQLTPAELDRLRANGFVVSDRLAFTDFSTAYAYIYQKDLPVLITTDSLLQAVHQTYDDLLVHLETRVLPDQLTHLLSGARQRLQTDAAANADPQLAGLYADLDTYLGVPLALLADDAPPAAWPPAIATYREQARAAQGVGRVTLFGAPHTVDFTVFAPRGHYATTPALGRYFQALTWLGQVDLRLVDYDPAGRPTLDVAQLAAAVLLRNAVAQAGVRATWQDVDTLLRTFVGASDNTTLPDLDRFSADAALPAPGVILRQSDTAAWLRLLTTRDYGQQRITSQILLSDPARAQPTPRPISFLLFGQRFVLDSDLMTNLAFDRLLVDGRKVPRPLPSPLDVMYALGNDRAATHLAPELARYGYRANLDTLRAAVDHYAPDFWTGSAYNRWLGALRPLGADTTGLHYPQALRTAAWADKMLETQLASWAQLRHDNILYAKFVTIAEALCSYPAGYVEPYPAFYAALHAYAHAGQDTLANLQGCDVSGDAREVRVTALTYFANLAAVTAQLQTLAEKELRLEPFSQDEETFLKSTTIHQVTSMKQGCVTVQKETWSGWYPTLFPWQETTPALIADVATNPNTDPGSGLTPPGVLHVGTGPVAATILIADTDEGPTMYVGPAFTYYDFVEPGFPPVRLTDQQWQQRLDAPARPAPPAWTAGFRLPVTHRPDYLQLTK